MELLTVKNETTVGLPDPVAPLTVPIGPGPTSSALAPLNAAMGNEHKASEPSDEIGLDRGGQSFKNLVFSLSWV